MDDRTKRQFLDEVLDPNKVIVYCSQHQYFGPVPPTKAIIMNPSSHIIRDAPMEGCAKCWEVYFLHEIGHAAPDKREEMLAELERVISDASQLEDARLFDFVVNRGLDYKIEKA